MRHLVLKTPHLKATLEDLFALSKTLQIYLIDGHGNRLGHFERYKL